MHAWRAELVCVVAVLLALASGPIRVTAQAPAYEGPRTHDGKPDLNGVWQALTTASWDIEDHNAAKGMPAGQGIVKGGPLPYQPWAAAQKQENHEHGMERDPLHNCYLPGVPRIMYMPFPFEITQTPAMIGMSFEYTHATRLIYMDGSEHIDGLIDFWMGDSRGYWDQDTLVVDVALLNDQTWFDRAGNFHSEQLHLVERYTPVSANHILYEATVEDPKVFTRPWTMSFPLYRRLEENVQVLDYECLEYEEPFLPWHESPAAGVPGAPGR